jgi:Exonuclease VII, large subunit
MGRTVPMAGRRAAAAVARWITAWAERRPDLIVVVRGGPVGELAWADSAIVTDAIVRCPVPVWTAIGHATDRTVADLDAHRSCETPSTAASALVGMVEDDNHRRRAAAAGAVHVAALTRSSARARVGWVACAVLVVLLVAVIVAAWAARPSSRWRGSCGRGGFGRPRSRHACGTALVLAAQLGVHAWGAAGAPGPSMHRDDARGQLGIANRPRARRAGRPCVDQGPSAVRPPLA